MSVRHFYFFYVHLPPPPKNDNYKIKNIKSTPPEIDVNILHKYCFTTYQFWFINWIRIWIFKLFLIMVLNYFPTSWISWFWYSLVLSIIHTQSRIVHLWRWPQTSFWTCARKPLRKKSWLRSISYDVVFKHSLVCLKLW